MPIRPENKKRYPDNWLDIRQFILRRANGVCEGCGLPNHSFVFRSNTGDDFCPDHPVGPINIEAIRIFKAIHKDYRRIKVVLTIAHLDHTPENCDPENLRAWCQKCHNSYDAPERAKNRKARKEEEADNALDRALDEAFNKLHNN